MGAQLPLNLTFGPRHVVLLSGGHDSALVAVEVVRRYGRNGTVLLNHDIHARVEDTDVKRFKREVAAALGVEITYANHPEWDTADQFDVVRKARAFKVRNGQELCTSRLKTEPFMAWLKANAPPGTVTLYYGFDATENHRILRRSTILAAQGYESAYPLAHWPRTIHSTREIGVEPPLTYGAWKHANCVGCLKAGWQHWYAVYATRPDVWARGVEAEDDIGHTIHRDASLEERAPQFAAMLAAGVEPTEQVPPGAFWADARRKVHLPVAIEAADAKPCECSKKKRRPAWMREPQRACLPEHGCSPRTHTLACIFARADERNGVAA